MFLLYIFREQSAAPNRAGTSPQPQQGGSHIHGYTKCLPLNLLYEQDENKDFEANYKTWRGKCDYFHRLHLVL